MVDQNLRLNEAALNWDPAEVTPPPAPAIPAGGDPMSVMISAIAPQVAEAVSKGVAEALAREQQFAANVHGARTAYQNTDGDAGQQIQGAGQMGEAASAAGGAGSSQSAGSGAGEASQLGQMMGMPMQMAQQAAQIPMQLASMAASIPQGIMQGVQSAMQSVGQMGSAPGDKIGSGSDQSGDAPRDELQHVDAANEKPDDKAPSAEGPKDAERAPANQPQPTPSPEAPQQPHKPAPTRPATSGPESVL